MRFSISLFLATRYLFAKSTSSIKTMIAICFFSIFIGTFSLALITSIMRGFEYETHKKLQGIYPSLFIKAPEGSSLSLHSLQTFIQKNLAQEIKTTAPYLLKDALLHPATTNHPLFLVTIKGIDPQKERLVTNLESMLQDSIRLENITGHYIVIGTTIAEQRGFLKGDQAVLVCNPHDDTDFNDVSAISVPVTIAGFIKTGIAEYDEHLVITSLDLCKKIWGDDAITHLGIALKDDALEKKVLETCKKIPDLEITSWKSCYPALVSALKLEKYAMFFVLLLITLVASMNIISLLFMFITYKKTDIALFKMLGMSTTQIYALFFFISIIIASIASLAGLIAAYLTGYILQHYPCITLPDIYYVTHLPITLELSLFLLIFLCTLTLIIIASLLPLYNLKKINITHTLRFE